MADLSFKRHDDQNFEVIQSTQPIAYGDALIEMDRMVKALQNGEGPEVIWFLEHPPTFTQGTSAKTTDVLHAGNIPVFESGRGGQVTYHGPGQQVVYLILDLKARRMDLRAYVWTLEEAILKTLATFGIQAFRREGRVGLWVEESQQRDLKIAALGVRIQKWVTSHGLALNITNDLGPYSQIIPCGIKDHGVTNLQNLLPACNTQAVQKELLKQLRELY